MPHPPIRDERSEAEITDEMLWAFACEFQGVNTVSWLERNRDDLKRSIAAAIQARPSNIPEGR